jgi:subtilisin-like proprotein convertase family protein
MKQGNRRAWLLIGATVGVLALAFAGLAGAKIKTKTFSSGDIDRAIPDPGKTSHVFDLKKKRFKRSKVKDVNVAVRISHEEVEDVLISVTAPNGREVDLSSMNGTPFDNDYGTGDQSCSGELTVFNDEAETPVEDAEAPFAGQFVPEDPLSELDRSRVKGLWRVSVEDYDAFFDGVLNCAELEVKYKKKKRK